jgi:hypothetical protein
MDAHAWYSSEDAARLIGGVSPRWIRVQVEQGRLKARVLLTGKRGTYRIRGADLAAFMATYIVDDARDREP